MFVKEILEEILLNDGQHGHGRLTVRVCETAAAGWCFRLGLNIDKDRGVLACGFLGVLACRTSLEAFHMEELLIIE